MSSLENSIDIAPVEKKTLVGLLRHYLPNTEVWAYGSRVKWTSGPTSDLDLVAFALPRQKAAISKLREALETSSLPFRVDLFVWNELPETFRESIRKTHVILCEGKYVNQGQIGVSEVSKVMSLSDLVEFNPSRSLKRGCKASFIDMASLSVGERDIRDIQLKEFNGGGSRFRNGDTLLARITPCLENGKTAKVSGLQDSENAFGSTEFIVLSAKDPSTDEDYVYYLARHPEFRSFAISRMEGTSGRQRVSWQAVSEFEFDFPEPNIRKYSARFLRILDDKIAFNRKLNETLEGMARALFQSWFVDFDPVKAKLAAVRHGRDSEKACMATISGKLRIQPGKPKHLGTPTSSSASFNAKADEDVGAPSQLPTPEELDAAIATLDTLSEAQRNKLAQTATHFPANFQESELGLIPEGWEVKSVDELVNRHKAGKKFTKKNVLSEGQVPVFEQGESILMGFHNESPDVDATECSPSFIFGDHTCVTHISISPFSVGPNVIPLKASIRDGFWTYYAVRDLQTFQEYRRHWMEFKIKTCEVPSQHLADEFGARVRKLYRLIKSLCSESRTLAELRDILLPKLLSGELSVGKAQEAVEAAVES